MKIYISDANLENVPSEEVKLIRDEMFSNYKKSRKGYEGYSQYLANRKELSSYLETGVSERKPMPQSWEIMYRNLLSVPSYGYRFSSFLNERQRSELMTREIYLYDNHPMQVITYDSEKHQSKHEGKYELEKGAIGVEDYRQYDVLMSLDCGHTYHAECIQFCLFYKNKCPYCKKEGIKDHHWWET